MQELLGPIANSRTLLQVFGLAVAFSLYALLPLWKENSSLHYVADIPGQTHAALSVVLGWLLVFRINTAYSRWWEARTLWGSLVNASRNLSIKVCNLGNIPESQKHEMHQLILAFPPALRMHLRDESTTSKAEKIQALVPENKHHPQGIVNGLYRHLDDAHRQSNITELQLRIFDAELTRYLDICGGCERIRRTRIVRSYRSFARQCVVLFLFTFPWAMVSEMGAWTIMMTGVIAYFMIGMETIAEHIEEPFGYDEDDLDLDGLCQTISNSVNEIFSIERPQAAR